MSEKSSRKKEYAIFVAVVLSMAGIGGFLLVDNLHGSLIGYTIYNDTGQNLDITVYIDGKQKGGVDNVRPGDYIYYYYKVYRFSVFEDRKIVEVKAVYTGSLLGGVREKSEWITVSNGGKYSVSIRLYL